MPPSFFWGTDCAFYDAYYSSVLIFCIYIILYIHCLLQPLFPLFVYTTPDPPLSISYFFVVFYYICGCVCGGHFYISPPSPLNILKNSTFQRVKYAKNRKATPVLEKGLTYRRYHNDIETLSPTRKQNCLLTN